MGTADQQIEKITAVHQIGDDIRSRFTGVARMKNYDCDDSKPKQLEDGIAVIAIGEHVKQFRDDLLDICNCIGTAETTLLQIKQ